MDDRAAELLESVRRLGLRMSDYAVFGSGPLIVRGIIDADNDIDIVARSVAWERARALGEVVTLDEHGIEVASFDGGAITVGTTWAYGDIDIDDLIDSAEVIEGLPFARLEYVVAYKRAADRPKDIDHLRSLRRSGQVPSGSGRPGAGRRRDADAEGDRRATGG